MIGVLAEDQPQVPLASDQHPVRALAAGTANPAAARSQVSGDHDQADHDERRDQSDPADGRDPEQDVVLAELAALLFGGQLRRAVARRGVVQARPAYASSWATEVSHDAS
jgi:hypothetical protein